MGFVAECLEFPAAEALLTEEVLPYVKATEIACLRVKEEGVGEGILSNFCNRLTQHDCWQQNKVAVFAWKVFCPLWNAWHIWRLVWILEKF